MSQPKMYFKYSSLSAHFQVLNENYLKKIQFKAAEAIPALRVKKDTESRSYLSVNCFVPVLCQRKYAFDISLYLANGSTCYSGNQNKLLLE